MTNVLVQGLAVEASFTGDPELVMQAVALDPLTAAVLTLEGDPRDGGRDARGRARAGCRSSPARTLRPVPAISIPKDVKRQEVPLDPALAIANRFGKLAKA